MSRDKSTGTAPQITGLAPFHGQLTSGVRSRQQQLCRESGRHGDPGSSCAPSARKITTMSDDASRPTGSSFRADSQEISVDVVLTFGASACSILFFRRRMT